MFFAAFAFFEFAMQKKSCQKISLIIIYGRAANAAFPALIFFSFSSLSFFPP